jgi:cell division septal protein FtsQ
MNKRKSKRIRRPGRRIWPKILLLIFLAFIWYESDRYFYVRHLECYTQFGSCPEKITNDVSWLIDYPLLKPLPIKKVREQLAGLSEIKSVNLYRRLPQTLVLSVALRKPIGLVGSQVLGMHVIADEEGVIIGQSDVSNLPLLMDDTSPKMGDKLDVNKLLSLHILGRLSPLSASRVIGKLSGSDLTAYLSGNTQVVVNLSHLAPNWYTTLQVILDRSKILTKIPRIIDLRFSSPIVTF